MLLGVAGCGSCQVSVVVRVSRWRCGSVVEQAEVALEECLSVLLFVCLAKFL